MTQKAEVLSTLTTFTYDEANRLTAITPATGSGPQATFTLDALGRIATRTVATSPNNTVETYAYTGSSETASERSSTTSGVTTTIRSLLDLDGSRLAIKPSGGSTAWTLFDQLGSLVGLENGAGTVTDARRYDGYGEVLATAGSTANPWRFRGTLDLSPTADALYDMGARFYAPSTGTFTQADTVAGSAQRRDQGGRHLLPADVTTPVCEHCVT